MKKADVKIGTIIGKGTVIGGDFTAPKSVRMDGVIEGNVKVGGEIVIGASGRVDGNIEAASIIIGGEVNGNVAASERIELTATARLIGNIKTSIVVIDEKAVFQGGCDMNQDTSGKAKKRIARETRAGKKSAKDALQEALREVRAETADDGEEEAGKTEIRKEENPEEIVFEKNSMPENE